MVFFFIRYPFIMLIRSHIMTSSPISIIIHEWKQYRISTVCFFLEELLNKDLRISCDLLSISKEGDCLC